MSSAAHRASAARPSTALLSAAVLALSGAASGVARAQTSVATPSGDAALAETLFDDAKSRMAAGDYAAACPKLAESYRLDPGGGTLTALAVCHESLGQTASAWTEFIQVVSEARQAGRLDRQKFAAQHVSALEPKLSKLTITVASALSALPGFEVQRDATVVGAAGWGTAAPVDPGEHRVAARATGKKPWSTKVTVAANGDLQTVTVPSLDDAPADGPSSDSPEAMKRAASIAADSAAFPAPQDRPGSSVGGAQRVIGLTLGGAGLVAVGVGTFFGLQAISKNNEVKGKCPDANHCGDPSALPINQDAKSAALAADVALAGGAAAIVAGALVYFLAPTTSASASAEVRVVPIASSLERGFALRVTW